MNKLPEIFKGKVESNINNKDVVYTSIDKTNDNSNIDDKINAIFSSKDFVVKKKVVIITKTGSIEKEVVGKNNKQLLTLDNDAINISDILDIK